MGHKTTEQNSTRNNQNTILKVDKAYGLIGRLKERPMKPAVEKCDNPPNSPSQNCPVSRSSPLATGG